MTEIRIGNRKFKASGAVYVMGILNVTPDSFSDGGRYTAVYPRKGKEPDR